jgi:tRNA pseudouridine55 synthase
MAMNWEEGQLILIDKPYRWTSFDVVKKLRNHLGVKTGHAGTLDPLATGLLIVATGKFTKKIEQLQGLDKVYQAVFEIGKTTPCHDLERPFDSETDFSHITTQDIEQAVALQRGVISQVPPAHSAIQVDGVRAYKEARKNKEVKLQPRQVTIHRFEILKIDLPEVHVEIECSKGTYIRSVVRDFGEILGVGAYLKELRRMSIGKYSVNDALTMEEFLEKYPKQ